MSSRKFDSRGRAVRHRRVRKRVVGSAGRPRLSVFRSNKQIYAQIIDDTAGRTVAAASSLESVETGEGKIGAATAVGTAIAKRAKDGGVTLVVFDRGGYKYHGRVKALAEAARSAGLEF